VVYEPWVTMGNPFPPFRVLVSPGCSRCLSARVDKDRVARSPSGGQDMVWLACFRPFWSSPLLDCGRFVGSGPRHPQKSLLLLEVVLLCGEGTGGKRYLQLHTAQLLLPPQACWGPPGLPTRSNDPVLGTDCCPHCPA
jgi:hypothetical protein